MARANNPQYSSSMKLGEVSNLLYMSLKNKKNYTQYENSLYGKILTKKEPIKTLGF